MTKCISEVILSGENKPKNNRLVRACYYITSTVFFVILFAVIFQKTMDYIVDGNNSPKPILVEITNVKEFSEKHYRITYKFLNKQIKPRTEDIYDPKLKEKPKVGKEYKIWNVTDGFGSRASSYINSSRWKNSIKSVQKSIFLFPIYGFFIYLILRAIKFKPNKLIDLYCVLYKPIAFASLSLILILPLGMESFYKIGLATLFFIIPLLCSIYLFIRSFRNVLDFLVLQKGIKTKGIIVSINSYVMVHQIAISRIPIGYKTYEYLFMDNGNAYRNTFDTLAFYRMKKFVEGDEISIIYCKDNPNNNRWLDG